MEKNIAILGVTGSIGSQTLEVVDQFPDTLNVEIIVAHQSVDKLITIAKKYRPKFCVIADESKYSTLHDALHPEGITCMSGTQAIADLMALPELDIVVAAIVGFAGITSTYNAVAHGKTVALANKETLVVAGDLIMAKAQETGAKVIPVDSEHSAIFQCLQGESTEELTRVILTASGGPFRTHSKDDLKRVTKKQALKHPNWDMGAKISIDSATMMNKGLEMIEAKWLFDLTPDQIDVVVHPQSIVHSFVEFDDGSLKAQCGLPDMRLAIQYALFYPSRKDNSFERYDFTKYPSWTFEEPRWTDFSALLLAKDALARGGSSPCVLNAANEVAVDLFLSEKVGFTDIPKVIEHTVTNFNPSKALSVEEYLETDNEARKIALQYS